MLRIQFIRRLREPLAVALFNAAHGPEQMAIRAGPELLRLAVEVLHHQRIEDADLLQCSHIAVNAAESCVQAVEKIVNVRFLCSKVFVRECWVFAHCWCLARLLRPEFALVCLLCYSYIITLSTWLAPFLRMIDRTSRRVEVDAAGL